MRPDAAAANPPQPLIARLRRAERFSPGTAGVRLRISAAAAADTRTQIESAASARSATSRFRSDAVFASGVIPFRWAKIRTGFPSTRAEVLSNSVIAKGEE